MISNGYDLEKTNINIKKILKNQKLILVILSLLNQKITLRYEVLSVKARRFKQEYRYNSRV